MANISITISPKAEGSRELIAIPRKEYEGLLRFYNVRHATKKKPARKKANGRLTKGLREALADVKAGRISKGFDNAEDLVAHILSQP